MSSDSTASSSGSLAIQSASRRSGFRFTVDFSLRFLSGSEAAALFLGTALCFLYAWTLDDAYIFYRYVDNAVLWGRGLVFNDGEFVEGFSSPLWTLLLLVARSGVAALDAIEYGTYWNIQRAIGIGCYLWFCWLCVRVNRILSPAEPRAGGLNLPLLHCSLNYSLLSYFSSGMATPLVLVSAAAYALYLLEPRSRWLGIWIGITPLIRHELAVPLLLSLTFLRLRHGRFFWPPIVSAAVLGGAYLLFRVYYYADWLPNTFYLKNIWWVSSGVLYLIDTGAAYWLPLSLIAILVILRIRDARRLRSFPHAAEIAMMILLSASIAAYVVKIGGDARHFRYLAFPYTLALLAVGGGLLENLRATLGRRFAAAAAVGVAVSTALSHPLQLESHPLPDIVAQMGSGSSRVGPALTGQFRQFAEAAMHRRPPVWGSHSDVESVPPQLPPGATVRHASSCWRIYSPYRQDYVVHSAGLTEPFIARMKLRLERPGHPIGTHQIAVDLVTIREQFGKRGAFRRAVQAGLAPDWIEKNLSALEVVERKAYNRHDFAENLGLAFRFIDDLPLYSNPPASARPPPSRNQ